MGFWDSVKKVATSAKCMTGLHAGDFKPVAGMPECNLEKTCPDCNKHLSKIEHNFSSWNFLQDKSCNAKRFCRHCNHEENSIRHEWKKYKNNCNVYKICERCQARENLGIEHGPWHAGVAHPNGMQTFQCSGCGKTEERKFDPNAR